MGLTIGKKITLGFGLVIVLVIALGAYQMSNTRAISALTTRVVQQDVEVLRHIRQIGNARRDRALELERAWSAHLAGRAGIPGGNLEAHRHQWTLLSERLHVEMEALQAKLPAYRNQRDSETRRELGEELIGLVDQQAQLLRELETTAEALFALYDREGATGHQALRDALAERHQRLQELNAQAEAVLGRLAAAGQQAVADLQAELYLVSGLMVAAVAVLAFVVGLVLYRSIAHPLRDFMRFVERVGSGDLTRTVAANTRDEVGQLGAHLNEMVTGLGTIARQVRSVVENLNAAAAEMEASVQQHASAASEQNAAIQQITSTLGEITRSGAQISERAKSVAASAEAAAAASRSGMQAVAETSHAMDAIREQAEKVAARRSEERRVGKECRSRWSPYH